MMRYIIGMTATAIMVCLILTPVHSQQMRAKTEDGKEVWLYPDGTWKYAQATAGPPVVSSKPASANKSIKGKRETYGIWIDENKWKLSEVQFSPQAELSFIHTGGDGYAMIIYERIQVPLETLKGFALKNAQNAAPDARITFEEKRTINGNEVLCLKIEGTLQSIPFIYFGYYYAGEAGTIQVITYTAQNLFKEFESDFAGFLNGFEVYTSPKSEERQISSAASNKSEIKFADGSTYAGDVLNGKMHGHGTYTWSNGDKYVGAFQDNRPTGGWLYKANGRKAWCYQDPQGNWIIKEQQGQE